VPTGTPRREEAPRGAADDTEPTRPAATAAAVGGTTKRAASCAQRNTSTQMQGAHDQRHRHMGRVVLNYTVERDVTVLFLKWKHRRKTSPPALTGANPRHPHGPLGLTHHGAALVQPPRSFSGKQFIEAGHVPTFSGQHGGGRPELLSVKPPPQPVTATANRLKCCRGGCQQYAVPWTQIWQYYLLHQGRVVKHEGDKVTLTAKDDGIWRWGVASFVSSNHRWQTSFPELPPPHRHRQRHHRHHHNHHQRHPNSPTTHTTTRKHTILTPTSSPPTIFFSPFLTVTVAQNFQKS
jgi:hypothetical protein